MIDDLPRVFSFDDSRETFRRKLAKAERESIFRRLRRLAGGRGCAAGGADRPPNRPAPSARIPNRLVSFDGFEAVVGPTQRKLAWEAA